MYHIIKQYLKDWLSWRETHDLTPRYYGWSLTRYLKAIGYKPSDRFALKKGA